MTKLMQLLVLVAAFLSGWMVLITDTLNVGLSPAMKEVVWASPIYLLMIFACYSLAVIGYRVATFNDCVAASQELQQQVIEARKDLAKKGFKFS